MGFLATIPPQTKSVAAVWPAFRQIGSIASTAFLPAIALPPAAKGWTNAVWAARAKALSFVVASALCASPAWSADKAAKASPAPEAYYVLPRCDDPAVFAQIIADYGGRHWASDVTGVGIRARETTIRKYWPLADMPRRFCEGSITPPSDVERPSFHPSYYPIYYAIIANGPGVELEWCAVGLDRAWPIDQRCRLARP
jgi:hypothetical protein